MPTIMIPVRLDTGEGTPALVGVIHIVAVLPFMDVNGFWQHSVVHLSNGRALQSDMSVDAIAEAIAKAEGR